LAGDAATPYTCAVRPIAWSCAARSETIGVGANVGGCQRAMRRMRLFRIGATSRLRVTLLVLVALGACGIGIATYATGVLKALEGNTVDARFSIRGNDRPPKNVVLLAIDDKTLQDLNKFPFPRSFYARVLDNLAPQHPRAVAFDIELGDKSSIGKTCRQPGLSLPCDDLTLLNSIGNH